jgi:DcuC family C4-dicarboxylate transporter
VFGFAILCGSGIAATQGLFPLFAGPAAANGVDPLGLGAITVVGSAAGRTASPVAAVNLMTARLAGVDSLELSRRVFFPVSAGLFAALATAMLFRVG